MPPAEELQEILGVTSRDSLARFVSETPGVLAAVNRAFGDAEESGRRLALLGSDGAAAAAPPPTWMSAPAKVSVAAHVPFASQPGSRCVVSGPTGNVEFVVPPGAVPGRPATVEVPGAALRDHLPPDVIPLRGDPGASEEIAAVTSYFAAGGGKPHLIREVYRLRNMSLWNRYSGSVKAIQARDGKLPRIRLLWHGAAHPEPTRTIHVQGFDPRLAAAHGRAYGHGAYFARDVSLSHSYATPDPACGGLRHMFLVAVCVGSPCAGRSDMLRPSPSPKGVLHDSAVDCVKDPSVTVIFEAGGAQALPLYVVAYADGAPIQTPPRALLQTDAEMAALIERLLADECAFAALRRFPPVRRSRATLPLPDAADGSLVAPTILAARMLALPGAFTPPAWRFSGRVVGDGEPLVAAVAAGDIAAVRALVGLGARLDVSMSVGPGTWPLLAVAARQSSAMTSALLELRADVEHRSPMGWAALHVCAAEGWRSQAALLLEANANPLARVGASEHAGQLASELARAHGRAQVERDLVDAMQAAAQDAVKRIRSAYARIKHFSFDFVCEDDPEPELSFEERYRASYDENKSVEAAEKDVAEFFRFLAIKAVHRDVTPPVVVDNVFHLALAYTTSYQVLCARACGRFLHHEPTPGGLAASRRYARQYEDALQLYFAAFGPPPVEVWPAVAVRMDATNQYVGITHGRLKELSGKGRDSSYVGCG